MHQYGHFDYGENEQLQMLALPYLGHKLQLFVLLPRSRDGIGQLESNLTPANLTAWTSAMLKQEADVALPKFKMSSGFMLVPALEALGLKDTFDPERADFSGMDGRAHWLYLNRVLHRAYIEVNERGTEAAAATAGVADGASSMCREFRADHPFLFLIRDTTTGSLLFTGRVAKPGA